MDHCFETINQLNYTRPCSICLNWKYKTTAPLLVMNDPSWCHNDRIYNRHTKVSIQVVTMYYQYCLHKFIISYIFIINVFNVFICGVGNLRINCHIRQWDVKAWQVINPEISKPFAVVQQLRSDTVNIFGARQNYRHSVDYILKLIYIENVYSLIHTSLKFEGNCPIINSALVKTMACWLKWWIGAVIHSIMSISSWEVWYIFKCAFCKRNQVTESLNIFCEVYGCWCGGCGAGGVGGEGWGWGWGRVGVADKRLLQNMNSRPASLIPSIKSNCNWFEGTAYPEFLCLMFLLGNWVWINKFSQNQSVDKYAGYGPYHKYIMVH